MKKVLMIAQWWSPKTKNLLLDLNNTNDKIIHSLIS